MMAIEMARDEKMDALFQRMVDLTREDEFSGMKISQAMVVLARVCGNMVSKLAHEKANSADAVMELFEAGFDMGYLENCTCERGHGHDDDDAPQAVH